MTPSQYLDAAKTKIAIESDYGIAKRLGVPRQSIPAMREGKRPIPLDVAYRIAIILEADPAQVVAELEAERETNPERAEFWRSFLSRAALLAGAIACTLAWSFSGMGASAPAWAGFGRRLNRA